MKNPFNIKNSIIGAFTGFVNGLFGSGGGTLLVPILNNILKVEEHKSHATALAIIIFLMRLMNLKNLKILTLVKTLLKLLMRL